jgi:hypothetical protein
MADRTSRDSSLLLPRRQALIAGAALGAAALMPRIARAASVPYEFECDRTTGFLPDPNQHKRVGYITALSGFGTPALAMKQDLQVYTPWSGATAPAYGPMAGLKATATSPAKASVVGVIEKFAWNGGVGDALSLDFYMSQENAVQLKTAQQSTLPNKTVSALGWWIINYDQEKKIWYEQSFPLNPTTVKGDSSTSLDVDLNPIPVKTGIDVMVYKVHVSVTPTANAAATLQVANTSTVKDAKAWGLQVGTWAAGATK